MIFDQSFPEISEKLRNDVWMNSWRFPFVSVVFILWNRMLQKLMFFFCFLLCGVAYMYLTSLFPGFCVYSSRRSGSLGFFWFDRCSD